MTIGDEIYHVSTLELPTKEVLHVKKSYKTHVRCYSFQNIFPLVVEERVLDFIKRYMSGMGQIFKGGGVKFSREVGLD